jgi:hypothetical protein
MTMTKTTNKWCRALEVALNKRRETHPNPDPNLALKSANLKGLQRHNLRALSDSNSLKELPLKEISNQLTKSSTMKKSLA